MTKNRLFSLLLTALIGGFVLSVSFDAFAADDITSDNKKTTTNDTKREQIEEFIHSKMVKVSSNAGNTKKTIADAIRDAENEVNETVDKYNSILGEVTKGCEDNESILSGLFPDKTQVLHKALGKSYSWSYHVDEVLGKYDCSALEHDENWQEKVKKAHELGTKLDNLRYTYQQLDSLSNYSGDIYEYKVCTKYDTKGKCTDWGSLLFIVNDDDNTLEAISTVQQGCVPLPFKLFEAKSCLFCPLFDVIYTAIQDASTRAFRTLGISMSNLAAIGLAIWIAFMVLNNVSSLTKQDAPKFLNDLFRNSFKVIIIIFMLRHSGIVYNNIIGPILKAGFEFGVSFLDRSSGSLSGCSKTLGTIGSGGGAGVLPQYIYANLMCFIKAVQMELAASQAIGESLMCVSLHQAKSNFSAIAKVMPDFGMMVQGALIYIISLILSLAFGFYLIDATVQLGIFGMILPFLLMCWPFKITNSYFKKGAEVFMNSWFVYVFMGIVVNISLKLIGQSLTGGKGGFNAIEEALNGNDVGKLQELLSIGFSGFLVLIACCIFAIKLMMKVTDLADQFSGGLGLGIGNRIGGLAASGATGAAKAIVGGGVKSVTNAKVWKSDDGSYKSLGDGFRFIRGKASSAVSSGVTGIGRGIGKVVASPVKFASKLKGKGRRGPSA